MVAKLSRPCVDRQQAVPGQRPITDTVSDKKLADVGTPGQRVDVHIFWRVPSRDVGAHGVRQRINDRDGVT